MQEIKSRNNRQAPLSTDSRNPSQDSLQTAARFPLRMASAFCWIVLVLGTVAPLPAQSAFVRVNQVGYPMNATKRAYLMSSTAETGGGVTI